MAVGGERGKRRGLGRGAGEARERAARVCTYIHTVVYKARAYVHMSYVWRSSYYTPFMHRVRRRAALRRDESSIRLNARQPGDALNQGCLPEHTYTGACTYVRVARLFEIPILRRRAPSAGRARRDESESDVDYCTDAFSCSASRREMYVFLAGVIDHE